MVGRSLFTRLTLATVAVLSSVTAQIQNGVYTISNRDYALTAYHELGATVYTAAPTYPPGLQHWVVKADSEGYRGYTIKHLGFTPEDPEYYLSPANPEKIADREDVILTNTPFYWDLYDLEGLTTIFVKEYNPVTPAVLGADLNKVEIQNIRSGDQDQQWEFRRSGHSRQQVQSRSGPWRIEKESFCFQ